MSQDNLLTLKQALRENRLSDFIKQEESSGYGMANLDKFEAGIKALTKPQPKDQTSH
jgi:hypothetical protein